MRARLGERGDEALRQRDRRVPQPAEPIELDALSRASALARLQRREQVAEPVAGEEIVPQAAEHRELRRAVLGCISRTVGLLVPLEQMNDAVEIAEALHERTQLLRREIGLHRQARRALEILGAVADEHGG